MWRAFRAAPGVQYAVPGAMTVLVVADSPFVDAAGFVSGLQTLASTGSEAARTVQIPVVYDGPDLAEVASLCDLTEREVVTRHCAASYLVGFLGFSPGFAYLFGGDRALDVPRLADPRKSVPAGSVAIAGEMTAVYPQATPGGWRLIGRAGTAMFDPFRDEPALLGPGDRVHFVAVDELPSYPLPTLSVPLAGGVEGPAIEVLDAGYQLTLQDAGRFGWGHIGVPAGGAADRRSAAAGQQLVGNRPGAAGLESTLGRFRVRVRGPLDDVVVAVTGATADVTVDGLPARPGAALHLRPGMELSVGPARHGVRVYLAVAGGLDGPVVVGSRSTDTLSGLGPAPVRAGDVIGIGARSSPPRLSASAAPSFDEPVVVTARLGPRQDWLHPSGRSTLAEAGFRVATSSDRTGIRLDGATLRLARSGELPSEGMVAGAVQVPPAGRPIVMMRNHPPTGGYPVVAVVDDAGVDALAQAGPGTTVRFRLISP